MVDGMFEFLRERLKRVIKTPGTLTKSEETIWELELVLLEGDVAKEAVSYTHLTLPTKA
mgnify:CR=1 FL=1